MADVQRRVGVLRAGRVFDGWFRFRKGLGDRGAVPDPEKVRDLLIEAEPVFADAATEEKRQLIANLLVNAACREGMAARIEAQQALDILAELPDQAAIVFALLVADAKPDPATSQPCVTVNQSQGYRDNPWFVFYSIVDGHLRPRQLLTHQNQAGRDFQFTVGEGGMWLANWVLENPRTEAPNPTDATEE